MIIKKNDDRNLLPTDVIGSSVARSKRWLVAIVRICHEKKTGERLTKMGIQFNKKSINGATAVKLSTGYCFR